MASHYPNVEDLATDVLKHQHNEISRLRIDLIRARSLLAQSQLYIGFVIKRWAEVGVGPEPAASVKADIEKFLEETKP